MINAFLHYVKIRELTKQLEVKEVDLRKKLVSLGVIKQNVRINKKPFLLTDLALQYGIGEIRHKPYGCGRTSAPYNIYFPTEIEKVLKRNIPLSAYNKNQSDSKPDVVVMAKEESKIEVNMMDYTNIDTDVSNSNFNSYNSIMDLTDEQKKFWLWEEYISRQAQQNKMI